MSALNIWADLFRAGLAALRPSVGPEVMPDNNGYTASYYGTDNDAFYVWNPVTGYWRDISGSSVAAGLTAGTVHTLAGATPMTARTNQFSVVANASDAGALPSTALGAVPIGAKILVINDGANPMKVWPQAADTIDGGAAGTAVTLTNGKRCFFTLLTLTAGVYNWVSGPESGVAS